MDAQVVLLSVTETWVTKDGVVMLDDAKEALRRAREHAGAAVQGDQPHVQDRMARLDVQITFVRAADPNQNWTLTADGWVNMPDLLDVLAAPAAIGTDKTSAMRAIIWSRQSEDNKTNLF
ncbi:hypothetical protein B0A48_15149 [Cryoendolithus antarcticus]|uniref:Uncharacterized protein n=1 Tax=Cryoendolithus antarcticus TaxID=1507870 RepID=A0A1V8SI86_9PEZI|nr:hypothetical protein B0A48_15149 [Cryoendolithus antarcticus]